MNWKEFFKPTKWKIISLITAMILGFISYRLFVMCQVGAINNLICKIQYNNLICKIQYVFVFIFLSIYGIGSLIVPPFRYPFGNYEVFYTLFIIISLIWAYLLVCIGNWIILKIKK